MMFVKGNWRLG